ncbi:Crystal protein ET79 [Streptomyces sp. NPDC018019]|uniref:Crystal protein ET79 n=1 Tax=Streptomyces sp. NPDC018019 TaxID=3365030 RepID=UPI0037A58CC4
MSIASPGRSRSVARWATTAAALAALAGGAAGLAPAAQAAPAAAKPADATAKSADAAAKPAGAAAKAARSVGVAFTNNTSQHLTRISSGLPHGCWSDNGLPQDYVARSVTATWKSESCGFATGTEGYTTYRITGTWDQDVTIRWNNPYAGSNSYSCQAPGGYQCTWSGGGGNNATVTFSLTGGPASLAANQVRGRAVDVTPVRSTQVKVVNETGTLLVRSGAGLSHGIWSGNNLPPSLIKPGERASWKSESEGFATGTEGWVEYLMSGGSKVILRWNNPFAGSNSYSCEAPPGHSCARSGGGGNNATVVFTIN